MPPEKYEIIVIRTHFGDYNVYIAGLHTHTIYSDGQVYPVYRVREAWRYGLDILAITDHIEYRPTENDMYRFMEAYIKDEYQSKSRGVNTNIIRKGPDERGIIANYCYFVRKTLSLHKQTTLTI